MAGLSPEDFQRMQASQLSDVETLDTLGMSYWSNEEFYPVGFGIFYIWDACLQETLLELKSRNYSLEEQSRKQKNALGEAEAKVKVSSSDDKNKMTGTRNKAMHLGR